jgi:flagellar biosynthesis/type III secretory pathway protein FliH
LYRVIIRDALGEGEVQPYQEVDLTSLLPFDKAQDRPFDKAQDRPFDKAQDRQSLGQEELRAKSKNPALSPGPLALSQAALSLQDLDSTDSTDTESNEPPNTSAPQEDPAVSAQERAEQILAQAQERAAEILEQARCQAEALQQEAQEQGMAHGREEVKKQLLPSLFVFAQAGQSLIVLEEQLVNRFTPEIVRLALEIAEKVVGKQVEEDPQIVASVLERAQAEIPQARDVRIWLHPSDYHTLMELRPDLVRVGQEGGRKVEVLTSEEMGRGGCRIETEMGVVDATISTQMQEVSRQMLDKE